MYRPSAIAAAALLCTALGLSATARAEVQRVPLAVSVNAQAKPDVLGWMADDGTFWVAVADLLLWGITVGVERDFDGTGAVSIKSLGDIAKFDEAQLKLVIDVDPTGTLGGTRIDLRGPKRPSSALLVNNGLRLDYELGGSQNGGSAGFDSNLVTRARFSEWQLLDERSFATTQTDGLKQLYSRTTVRRDWPEHAMRLDLGSLTTPASGLTAWSSWVGISLGKVYGMRPGENIENSASLDTLVRYPSTAEVFVNGIRQGIFKVQPGQLDLDGIRSTSGSANVRVVLRDAYGEETVVEDTRYLSQDAVKKGVHEYTYQIGMAPSTIEGTRKFGVRGVHRLGVTENLTVGARLQLDRELKTAQLDAVYQHPQMGAFGASALAGRTTTSEGVSHDLSGYALEHEYRSVQWSVQSGLTSAPTNPYKSELLSRRVYSRATYDGGRYGQWLLGVYRQADEQLEARTGVEVSWSKPLGKGVSTQLSVVNDSFFGLQARAWVVWALGQNRSVAAVIESNDGRQSQELTYSQSSSRWDEAAWRVSARQQNGNTGARAAYEQGVGSLMLRAQASSTGKDTAGRVSAQGAVLLDGNSVGLARSSGDAAVLVKTNGPEGVRVYRNGLLAGKTDSNGEVWVSGLVSYDEARLSLDENDIPMDKWYLPNNVARARPAPGALGVVDFDLRRIESFRLNVKTCDASGCTVAGDVQLVGTSDLGSVASAAVSGGVAVFEFAAAGAYSLATADGRCTGGVDLADASKLQEVALSCK